MDRQVTPVLLIPLIAALALLYPVVGRRPTTSSTQVSGSQEEPQEASGKKSRTSDEVERRGGRKLVHYFLGWPREKETLADYDSRKNTEVEFLIATVPDPVDSGLPHMFDRRLDAIQAALQRADYLPTGRLRLPWRDCLMGRVKTTAGEEDDGSAGAKKAEKKEDKQKTCEQKRPFRSEPGVILLRYTGHESGETSSDDSADKPNDKANDRQSDKPNDQSGVHLLLLYLIGETPIHGIHKAALRTALDEVAWFCSRGQEGDPEDRKRDARLLEAIPARRGHCNPIRILGPTFSGSEQSLDFALTSWLNAAKQYAPTIRMASGSATAIDPGRNFQNVRAFYRDKGTLAFFNFTSMEAPDKVTSCEFLNYLKGVEHNPERLRVALLSEGGTVYGNAAEQPHDESQGAAATDQPKKCQNDTEVTAIKFPLHISQLRAASERIRESQQQTSPQLGPTTEGLPLSKALEEVNQPHDTMPPLSPLDPLTAEQAIGQLLSTISRERYRYVGILATDARDTMFLAQEIREHCPSTVVFAFDPDVLFLHPEVNPSLRGMLLVTTYPLFNPNLLWSPPHPPHGKSHMLMQFPDQGSEGTYNAALALMADDDRLLEYGPPFEPTASQPPLWITVVGSNRIWPVEARVLEFEQAEGYLYPAAVTTPDDKHDGGPANADDPKEEESWLKEKESWFRGIYPTGTKIFMAAVSALGIVFCLPLLRRFFGYTGQEPAARWWFGGARLERFLGEASEPYRRPGDLYLLGGCTCVGIFLMAAIAASLGPVIVMRELEVNVWARRDLLVLMSLGLVAVVALLAAGAALLWALRPRPGQAQDELNPSALGFAIVVMTALAVCGVFLSGHWIAKGGSKSYCSGFFTSLRSLDLLSGVSPLLPLFLIFTAGFLWALSSFRRVRQLARLDGGPFLLTSSGRLSQISPLEEQVLGLLARPALRLPGAIVVVGLAVLSIGYLFRFNLVISYEDGAFYWLLGIAFFAVHLALWCSVLRFSCVWGKLRILLRHLHCAPPRAYSRFAASCPAARKIDLASPPPTLSSVAYSIDQARTLSLRAQSLGDEQRVRLKPAVGDEGSWASAEIKSQGQEARWSIAEFRNPGGSAAVGASELTPEQVGALNDLGSREMSRLADAAETHLQLARAADGKNNWRAAVTSQAEAHQVLAQMFQKVSLALEKSWWKELHGSSDKPAKLGKSKPEEDVFRLGEDFLVGRVANFLACVLPQMQNLIVTSVCGLLLMLLAISSYPFQPHNLLLLFNWAVILSFVGIAMWVFIQMNRDPVLSSLNGTPPGKISWDWNFAFRIFMYGIVPILALLGAQFPQSVGQIVSHLVPSNSGH